MKKIIITAAVLAGLSGVCAAAPISPEEALGRLCADSPSRLRAAGNHELKLCYTAANDNGNVAYIFTPWDGKGFTILSADSRAVPVLGYSDTERFDPENIPSSLKWMLGMYGEQLDNVPVSQPDYNMSQRKVDNLKAIAPMVKTRWDQSAPYDRMTPLISGVNPPTGCVATSVAQVMNYFKYPDVGVGTIRYKMGLRTLQVNLETNPFKWDDMLDYYIAGDYTDAQADAVANLMRCAGYSVQMSYGTDASGAMSYRIADAMIRYFKYDNTIVYVPREAYSTDEWVKMIYDNLANVGPVIYNGSSPLEGGHSFVCDGYDGEGYFHINWGWGGMSDGYYSLDILGPGAQGTGGSIGNFSYSQDAVLGMKPIDGTASPLPVEMLFQYGATKATLTGETVSFQCADRQVKGWGPLCHDLEAYVGAIIEKVDGDRKVNVKGTINGNVEVLSMAASTLISGEYNDIQVKLPKLDDGKYKVTVSYSPTSGTGMGEWFPVGVAYGYPNYAYVTVSGGKYSVADASIAQFELKGMELTSPFYYSRNVRMKLNLVNESDLQVTSCVTPRLMRGGKTQMQGASRLIVVDPNSTVEYEWITPFYATSNSEGFVSGNEYSILFLDQDTGKVYGEFGPFEMTSVSNTMTLKCTELVVEGLEKETIEVDGRTIKDAYVIPDVHDFTVDFAYELRKGYFDSEISLGIYEKSPSSTTLIPLQYIYNATPFMAEGESKSEVIKVDFQDYHPGKLYYIRSEYLRGTNLMYMTQIPFIGDDSGVAIIGEDSACASEYYTLQGVRIDNPEPGQVVIERRGSETFKRVWR